MKGEIGIQSELGVGTTVWFTAEFEYLNIQKSTSNLLREKQLFSLRGHQVLIITPYLEIATSIQSILGYYNIIITAFPTVKECESFIHSKNIQILRVILDQIFVEEFFNSFDRNNISSLINSKFICMVPLRRTKQKINNIDYILPTPFKLNILLNYFDCSNKSNVGQVMQLENNLNNNNIIQLQNNNLNNINNSQENLNINFEISPTSPQIDRNQIKILIAEDNLVNQKLLLRQLKKVGYEADAASNGREAVEKARQNQYNLILMDCHMPEMDGYEATKLIREQEVKRRVPIVALTADAMQGTRDRCLAVGMDDYYTKPLKQQDIEDITSKFLDSQ